MALIEVQQEILTTIQEGPEPKLESEWAWDEGRCAALERGEPPLKANGQYWDEANSRVLLEDAVRTRALRSIWMTAKEIARERGTIEPEATPVAVMVHGRPTLVYNVTETRGLADKYWRHSWEIHPVHHDPRDREFERFVATLDVPIQYSVNRPRKESRAAYREDTRRIRMPPFELFYSAHDHYLTLAHELVHWADHSKGLLGDLVHLGDDEHAWREMVAEIGAAFTCAELGLSTVPRDRTVAYVRGWRDNGGFNDAEVRQAAEDAARVVTWLVHSAPGWSATAEEPERQAREEPHLPPDARPRRFTRASALASAATARRFVADALALERSIRGSDRGAWDRDATRLLEAARAIDLEIPAIAAAIEAAVALETPADAQPPSAVAWLREFQERTQRILGMRALAKSADDMSANVSRGPRITP